MKKKILLFALAVALGLSAAAARADRDDRGYRDWDRHARDAREWHHRHWHEGRIMYGYDEPYVTYAPPIIVAPPPPPPVYYQQEPGLNIVVPLNIR